MSNFNSWSESIFKEIQNFPQKKIVLIAGASGSGKSHNSKKLKSYLTEKGLNAVVFSADNYYKGISRLLVEKLFLENPDLAKYKNKQSEIVTNLKQIIESSAFTEKFNETNFNKIIKSLKPILGADCQRFSQEIKRQFEQINFDDPFALDLKALVSDINKLLNNQSIVLPDYSFATGEVTFDENNKIQGNNTIFIVEGLYVLRDDVFGMLDSNRVIPCLVDCDLKTLLSRRLNRDIKSGRTTYTPEQTIITTLAKTMPSYCKYIEPYNKNSKFTVSTSLTKDEIISKESSSQLKFMLNNYQIKAIKALQLISFGSHNQIDHYLCDSSSLDSFIVRIREENGMLTKLTFKNNYSNNFEINRKIEEYNLSDFSTENSDVNKFLKYIKNSGFKEDVVIKKQRQLLKYGDCTFKLDYIPELGTFIEFDELSTHAKKLINLLKLTDIQNMSYLELLKEKSKTPTINIEKEYKFKVDKLPKTHMKKQEIIQFYFDFNNLKHHLLSINNTINFENVTSSRIRIIKENGKIKYFLTLKSSGTFSREEQEMELDEKTAKYLIKNAHSYIKKTRHILAKDGINFEFDEFENGLIFAEVEIKDENIASYEKILKILNSLNINYTDVTNNPAYKNQNMALSIKSRSY